MKTREIVIDPPAPHSDLQAVIMRALMTPDLVETYVAAGTKAGKTLSAVGAFTTATARCQKPMSHWRTVAPIYRQAQISLDYARSMLPTSKDLVQVRRSQSSIYLAPTADGSSYAARMEFLHGQDPYTLEGAAVDGYLLDEAAKMSPKVYASAKTTTTRTNGPMLFTSTPLGKNWFYERCMDAQERMRWAIKNDLPITHLFLNAPTSINPYIDKAVIERARKSMSERLFRQYYLAEFVDDGTVFSNFRSCTFGPPTETFGEHLTWLDDDFARAHVVLGVDWARSIDWTVFFAIDIGSRRVVGYERFQKRPYTDAVRMLRAFGKRFASVLDGMHDKTGVGVAIDDMCQALPFPLRGVTFTNQSKTDLVNRLITTFELEDLAIPNWGILLDELDSFEGWQNALGTISYAAAEGKHDDAVCALMLANAALGSATTFLEVIDYAERPGKRPEDEKDDDASAVDRFYRELADDDDD